MAAIVEVMSNPLTTALQATGKIRNVQLTVCIIMLCELPAAYLILKTGGEPYISRSSVDCQDRKYLIGSIECPGEALVAGSLNETVFFVVT